MSLGKNTIINDLYNILTSSIANKRFFKNRSKGFKAELEYNKKLNDDGTKFLDGGQFLFSRKNIDTSPENLVTYVTVSSDDKDRYVGFYELIEKLHEVEKLFFVEIEKESNWSTKQILVKNTTNRKNINSDILKPGFKIFKFENRSWVESDFDEIKDTLVRKTGTKGVCANKENLLSYMSNYSLEELITVYCNRYFLDIELGRFKKGMMDFDHILVEDDKFIAIETKEKDPIKDKKKPLDKKQWAFGWDSRRIGWYMHLNKALDLDTRYVIREVNNQTERKFLKWKLIELEKFRRCASWLAERSGGGGGGTISVPYEAFDDI